MPVQQPIQVAGGTAGRSEAKGTFSTVFNTGSFGSDDYKTILARYAPVAILAVGLIIFWKKI